MARPTRDIDRKRWRRSVVEHLEDYPRQLETLRWNVASFGDDFDLAEFAAAFSSDEPAVYTRVQAIERAFGRLQNYTALMAENGANLAGLARRPVGDRGPKAQPAFEAIRDAGVLTKDLCRRLVALQRSRNLFEHDYVRVQAADVHEAVASLLAVAPDFLDRFARWVAPFLSSGSPADR